MNVFLPSLGAEEMREWVDHYGYATLQTRLGSAFNGKDTLPIDLVYHSGGDEGGLLPGGWVIPQLESRLVQTSESVVRVDLPDGRTLTLEVLPDGQLKSLPGLGARREGEVVFLDYENAQYIFRGGRLQELNREGRPSLQWAYDKNGTSSAIRMDGIEVVSVDRSERGADGRLVIEFEGVQDPCVFHYVAIPPDVAASLDAYGEGFLPSIERITFPDGFETEVLAKSEGEEEVISISGFPTARDSAAMIVLDRYTRRLKRLNDVIFDIEYPVARRETRYELPKITAQKGSGSEVVLLQKSKYGEKGTGRQVEGGIDDVTETFFISTEAGRQVRKIIVNGEEVFRAYYDSEGRKLVTVEDGVRIEWYKMREDPDFAWPYPKK